MPVEPVVVTRAREFKAALLRREEAQMAEMVRRWRGVEVALQAQIENMAQFAATEAAAGRALTQQALLTMDRYQSLLRQTNAEIGRYGAWAERAITSEQASLAALGLTQATELVGISAEAAQIAGTFSRLPVQAVEQMVGLAGDGTPLGKLLAQAWPDAVAGLTEELVTGIALGRNPRVIAQRMIDNGLATGLQRAMTIARTEQLRAYRQASQAQYKASRVVTGYKRLAAHDDRVCLGCLVQDGQLYALEVEFEEHVQGRCTLLPVLAGANNVTWESGETWLNAQSQDTQRQILGPGRLELWKSGKVAFADMATVREDAVWGNSVVPTPVRDLVGR